MAIITPFLFALRNYKSLKSSASLQLIFNVLFSTSIFYFRYTPFLCSKLPAFERNQPCQLDWRESEVLIFLMIFISMKNRNSISWEQSIRRSLTYTKAATAFLFFRMHIFAGLVFLIVGMIRIKFFNDDSTSDMKAPDHIVFFSEEVLKETLEADKKVVWVIEAFTNWSKECEHVAPVFTDIAADYAHEFLRFGKIDVGKYPETAKLFAISTSPMSKQLPTIMVFEGGKMAMRRPEILNKKLVKFSFSYEDIEKQFNMQFLFNEAFKKKGKAKLPEYVPQYQGSNTKKVSEEIKKKQ